MTVMLSFGQPMGAVVQYAYVVKDVERSAADFADRLSIGPWFVRGPFQPPAGLHRGQPTQMTVTLARAFSGQAMIELIQQHDDGQSVFHEQPGPRSYGFHHWAVMTDRFEDELARYAGLGYEQAFSDVLPSGSRVVYVDATRDLPGMIEVIEHSPAQERVYDEIYRPSLDWDRVELLRREGG